MPLLTSLHHILSHTSLHTSRHVLGSHQSRVDSAYITRHIHAKHPATRHAMHCQTAIPHITRHIISNHATILQHSTSCYPSTHHTTACTAYHFTHHPHAKNHTRHRVTGIYRTPNARPHATIHTPHIRTTTRCVADGLSGRACKA